MDEEVRKTDGRALTWADGFLHGGMVIGLGVCVFTLPLWVGLWIFGFWVLLGIQYTTLKALEAERSYLVALAAERDKELKDLRDQLDTPAYRRALPPADTTRDSVRVAKHLLVIAREEQAVVIHCDAPRRLWDGR